MNFVLVTRKQPIRTLYKKAKKKFNSKIKSYKPKTVSKKQQLADQHRREKVLTDTPPL
jgi:hypothetical protein